MNKVIGTPFSLFVGDRYSLEGFKALRVLGLNTIRLSWNLGSFAPSPDQATWKWDELDACVRAIRNVSSDQPVTARGPAALDIDMNPGGCPAFASEGQPAYEDAILSSVWWNDPDHRDVNQLHKFDQTPGSLFFDVDILQPPRPWLANPPHMDPKFFQLIGRLLVERYRPEYASVSNEYGDKAYVPQMIFDSVSNDPPGPDDVVKEWLIPEMVGPFFNGAIDAMSVLGRPTRYVGPDADSDIILDRCLEEISYDFVGVHPYDDVRHNMDYASSARFSAMLDKHGIPLARRWCSEIGGTAQQVLDWWRGFSHLYSGVIMMPKTIFMPGWPNDLTVSAEGREFAAEFAKVNGPVVSVGGQSGRNMGRRG